MRLQVILTQDEDGYVVAECPAIPGCVSQGNTHEEAMEMIKDAAEILLEVRLELGLPLLSDVRTVSVKFPKMRRNVSDVAGLWKDRPELVQELKEMRE